MMEAPKVKEMIEMNKTNGAKTLIKRGLSKAKK
jgi:hypothetical protein